MSAVLAERRDRRRSDRVPALPEILAEFPLHEQRVSSSMLRERFRITAAAAYEAIRIRYRYFTQNAPVVELQRVMAYYRMSECEARYFLTMDLP